jgi:MYXO-CTERM domain-containing protein
MSKTSMPWLILPLAIAACIDEPELENPFLVRDRAQLESAHLTTGVLTAASNAPAETLVQTYLLDHPELLAEARSGGLTHEATRSLGKGELVTLRQHIDDIPVLGAGVTGRTDGEGRLRWVSSQPAAFPEGFSTRPAIGADEIMARLAELPRFASTSFAGARTSLVVFALGAHASSPRLAWQIELPLDTARMQAPVIIADANSGAVLSHADRVRRAVPDHAPRARIFEIDPLVTPELSEVALARLSPGATHLRDPDFEVFSCLDRQECQHLDTADSLGAGGVVHFCSFGQLAQADIFGDFRHIAPPQDHTDAEDAFAELSAYHYLSQALDTVRDRLGMPELLGDIEFTVLVNTPGQFMGRPEPATCIENADGEFSVPPGQTFAPLDNAFYAPMHLIPGMPAPLDRPTIAFGQGAHVDFAYGGDVAYHEFGHALFESFGQRGLGLKYLPDALGLDPSPGALDEGFSDYIAFMISGSPVLGRYLSDGHGIRGAEHDKRCPQDLTGEVHDDGEPWVGALWAIRQALPEHERHAMDAAVLFTMMAFRNEFGYGNTSEVLLAEIELEVGPHAAKLAREELSRRGLLSNCNDRIRVLEHDEEHDMLWAEAPGPTALQFRLELLEPTAQLELRAIAQQAGIGAEPAAFVHIKPGAEPILWDWSALEFGAVAPPSDADLIVRMEFEPHPEFEDALLAVATARGEFAPGTYHLQIDIAGPHLIFYAISAGAADEGDQKGDCIGGGRCDAEVRGSAHFGCSAGQGSGLGGAWILALMGLAMIVRRRRRASAC